MANNGTKRIQGNAYSVVIERIRKGAKIGKKRKEEEEHQTAKSRKTQNGEEKREKKKDHKNTVMVS